MCQLQILIGVLILFQKVCNEKMLACLERNRVKYEVSCYFRRTLTDQEFVSG